jgi:anthranilate synthase component 1
MNAQSFSIETEFAAVQNSYDNGRGCLAFVRRVDDVETPISAFTKLGASRFGTSLFESVEGGETRGRYSVVTAYPDLIFQVTEDGAERADIDDEGQLGDFTSIIGNPLNALRSLISESALDFPPFLPPPLAGLYGYLAYDMVQFYEKLPRAKARDPIGAPLCVFTRPKLVIVFDGVKQELLLATPIRPVNGVSALQAFEAAKMRLKNASEILDKPSEMRAPKQTPISTLRPSQSANQTPEQFMAGVEKAKSYIHAGDIYQVVPSQRITIDFNKSPVALYRALRRTNPSPFLFLLQMDGFSIIGSSPEILVRLRDGTVIMRPIAGTRPRGATPALDAQLEEDLLSDPKELAEHLMLLDLGRNDVGRVSRSASKGNQSGKTNGGVRVTSSFQVERYSHVMHIVSNVEGSLKPELDALDALLAGFPAGTVSGAPKIRAMEIIAELEPHDRGIYSGGVGYFSANGDMDMCIALRTGVLKDKKLHIQAGAGVVLDSIPSSEHKECENKAMALIAAATDAERYED